MSAAWTWGPSAAPVWTSRSEPEEIVGYAVRMADRLLERERTGKNAGSSMEFARTQPQKAE